MCQDTRPEEDAPGRGDRMFGAVISSQISLTTFQAKSHLDAFGTSQSDSNVYSEE